MLNRLEHVGKTAAAEAVVRQSERDSLKQQAASVSLAIESARKKLKLHRTGGGL